MKSKMAVDDEILCNAIAEEHLFDTFQTAQQPISTQSEHCASNTVVSNPIHIEIVNNNKQTSIKKYAH